jgi:hypothetical protein
MRTLKISTLPKELQNKIYYNKLQELKPSNKSVVSVFDKTRGLYEDRIVSRTYCSYGVTPIFDSNTNKSYMFNEHQDYIPDILLPYLDFARSLDKRYNNIYINWYGSGDDFIDPHSDCTAKMVDNSSILIINLNEGNYERTFKLQHKYNQDVAKNIKLKHGMCILIDSKEQQEYRHWVDKEETKEGRISLTFRMIKEI